MKTLIIIAFMWMGSNLFAQTIQPAAPPTDKKTVTTGTDSTVNNTNPPVTAPVTPPINQEINTTTDPTTKPETIDPTLRSNTDPTLNPANTTTTPAVISTDPIVPAPVAPAPTAVDNSGKTTDANVNNEAAPQDMSTGSPVNAQPQNNSNPDVNAANASTDMPLDKSTMAPAYSETMMIGLTRFAAVPVLSSYVPDDVVGRLKTKYGDKIYDILRVKAVAGTEQYKYIVRWQENGLFTSDTVEEGQVASL
jgi:hypothetical protein